MEDNGSNLKCGSRLQGGKYVIEKTLGNGGFGITYLGVQVALKRKVAIKEFFMRGYCERDSGTSNVTVGSQGSRAIVDRFRVKFVKEAQTIAQLDNPRVIKIHDIFEENGTAYYVMEHIGGGSLEDYVNKRRRLDEATAVGFVSQIADALSYIHGKNILHLDVKPSNILLRENGDAVLIDFGISKRYDERGGQTSTTPVGISMGYAPIEQYMQGGVSQFAPSTDVYSLGAVLYKLLTGECPEEAMLLINAAALTIPSYVSARCASVIRKAMSVKWSDRYQSTAEMKAALGAVRGSARETTILNIDSDKGKMNGHEYVDLGLSVKWATCNVGANSPTEYGNYYAWGEIYTKREYTKENSRTYGMTISDIADNSCFDAAHFNLHGSGRLPTNAEFEELIDNCESEWTTQNGVKGRKFTSNKNGKSIFLPAAGCRDGSSLLGEGRVGRYWSSTPSEKFTPSERFFWNLMASEGLPPDESNWDSAWNLSFNNGHCLTLWSHRSRGQSVRPVSE